ncbi:hypothetical protein PI125_g13156 [Phytophthora idaei]|nr:hypothetical protein PI125_g13156 [Phytophthora idaei]KAG3149074.1 hypothetical protein PI126_g12201 [Phytophthora idaei]
MSDEKRRNYSEEEDVMLLHQVLGDRPFQAQRGKITGTWDALAAKLVADDSFPRLKLSGKNAQSCFDKLIKTRRQEDEESMAASGVSEEESEKSFATRRADRAHRRPHRVGVRYEGRGHT